MKTGLENVFQCIITGGWANESDGNVEAPTGAFARVSSTRDEVMGWPGGMAQAFSDELSMYEVSPEELIGDFLVREDSQGNVFVTAYDNPIQLTRDYIALQDEYAMWDEE